MSARTISLCLSTACLFAAAATASEPPREATATLRSEQRLVRIVDVSIGAERSRRFLHQNGTIYRSTLKPVQGSWLWTVDIAHPYQLGRVRVMPGRADGLTADGRVLWSGTTRRPVCLPELLAEVAVVYDAEIRAGRFICMTPVPKAKKLAPLSIRRLRDGDSGRRRYEIGPGSLGMRLFIDSSVLELSADGRAVLGQRGQFEAASGSSGRFRYLEGDAIYSAPRQVGALPDAFRAVRAAP
jgi:hypothetical protein